MNIQKSHICRTLYYKDYFKEQEIENRNRKKKKMTIGAIFREHSEEPFTAQDLLTNSFGKERGGEEEGSSWKKKKKKKTTILAH